MAKRQRRKPIAAVIREDTERWTNRLDESIVRLAQATTALSAGVSAHTQRLDSMEQQQREQKEELTNFRDAHVTDYRTLNERITTVQSDLTSKITLQTETLTKKLDDTKDEILKNLGKRVGALESWRTFIAGGTFVIVIVFVYVLIKWLGTLPLFSFLK